jgi:hypothetical protein
MSKESAAKSIVLEERAFAEVIPIRTETVLSQFPLHRLSKSKEPLEIHITKENARGKAVTTWKVSPSREYGEPGILAYKIDTLIINRFIDDLRPNIPEVVKLGSLRDICRVLEISEGRNREKIKDALSQNAFAGITANLTYTGHDRRERTFEFRSTRYGIVFTGEKLPDGRRADAVYIILNPLFRELLRHATTRPLDYDYLRQLPPAAQRLYELLSFQIFAAFKNGNPRAKYLYSDLCRFAPLTRYFEWERVKKQLYKVHKPHITSGYIKGIEYEEKTDGDGLTDWVMRYTPGDKARREYEEFNTRKIATQHRTTPPRLVEAKEIEEGSGEVQEHATLIARLAAEGITDKKARELAVKHRDAAERELDAFPHRERSKMKDPVAWLIGAIESGDYSQPPNVEAKRRQEEATHKRKAAEARREQEAAELSPLYAAYLHSALNRIESQHASEYGAFCEDERRKRQSVERIKSQRAIDAFDGEESRQARAVIFFLKHQVCPILDFEDWKRAGKPVE